MVCSLACARNRSKSSAWYLWRVRFSADLLIGTLSVVHFVNNYAQIQTRNTGSNKCHAIPLAYRVFNESMAFFKGLVDFDSIYGEEWLNKSPTFRNYRTESWSVVRNGLAAQFAKAMLAQLITFKLPAAIARINQRRVRTIFCCSALPPSPPTPARAPPNGHTPAALLRACAILIAECASACAMVSTF